MADLTAEDHDVIQALLDDDKLEELYNYVSTLRQLHRLRGEALHPAPIEGATFTGVHPSPSAAVQFAVNIHSTALCYWCDTAIEQRDGTWRHVVGDTRACPAGAGATTLATPRIGTIVRANPEDVARDVAAAVRDGLTGPGHLR